jgi:nucleotide-binding universal stress UspA family protein
MGTRPVMIVGVDGSPAARDALGAAADLARVTQAFLVAVHVAHVPGVLHVAPASGSGSLHAATELTADEAHVDCELVLAGRDVAWTFEARHGDAATELRRAADDHDAACIVIGRHRHGLVSRLLLGSVGDRLVHHAQRPVVVVPAER